MRKIGKNCIAQRFKAITNKEEVPNDILTQIVRVASSDSCRGVDLEDLVDDFVTFYVAGESTCTCTLNFTVMHRASASAHSRVSTYVPHFKGSMQRLPHKCKQFLSQVSAHAGQNCDRVCLSAHGPWYCPVWKFSNAPKCVNYTGKQ